MTNKPERSVEKIVEEFDHRTYPCLKDNPQTDGERIGAHYRNCEWFRKTLTAERQRCDEMVEVERKRFENIIDSAVIDGETQDWFYEQLKSPTPFTNKTE